MRPAPIIAAPATPVVTNGRIDFRGLRDPLLLCLDKVNNPLWKSRRNACVQQALAKFSTAANIGTSFRQLPPMNFDSSREIFDSVNK